MTAYVALLRAVNVGGTGKLAMTDLKAMCDELGFQAARTYIASGNAIFKSDLREQEVQALLAARLQAYAGKPVGTLIRTASELADVIARNPFKQEPGNATVAIFVDAPIPPDALHRATGVKDERMSLGLREIFVFYGAGMGTSRLRIPAADTGTARNMNTVAKLAEIAAAL